MKPFAIRSFLFILLLVPLTLIMFSHQMNLLTFLQEHILSQKLVETQKPLFSLVTLCFFIINLSVGLSGKNQTKKEENTLGNILFKFYLVFTTGFLLVPALFYTQEHFERILFPMLLLQGELLLLYILIGAPYVRKIFTIK